MFASFLYFPNYPLASENTSLSSLSNVGTSYMVLIDFLSTNFNFFLNFRLKICFLESKVLELTFLALRSFEISTEIIFLLFSFSSFCKGLDRNKTSHWSNMGGIWMLFFTLYLFSAFTVVAVFRFSSVFKLKFKAKFSLLCIPIPLDFLPNLLNFDFLFLVCIIILLMILFKLCSDFKKLSFNLKILFKKIMLGL